VRMEAWQGRFILDSRSFSHHADLDKGGLLMEAIWPSNKPHRLGFLQRPWDFLRVAVGDQHAKSPPKNLGRVGRDILRVVA
jgi:hypothetical protein